MVPAAPFHMCTQPLTCVLAMSPYIYAHRLMSISRACELDAHAPLAVTPDAV